MKNKAIALLLLLGFYFVSSIYAQEGQREIPEWVKTMKKYPVNLQLLEKQFEEYWKDKMEEEDEQLGIENENNFPIKKEYGWLNFYLRQYFEMAHLRFGSNKNTLNTSKEKFRSQAVLGNWSSMGPLRQPENPYHVNSYLTGIGRVNQLAFSGTNANVMYALSPSALFISTDTANTWQSTGTDWISFTDFQCLAVDPTSDSVIYIGIGGYNFNPSNWLNAAILKSTDFGQTFTPLNNGIDSTMINAIEINPYDHNEIIAVGYGGIWKSTDAGSSWAQTYTMFDPSITGHWAYDVKYKPGSADTVYATTDSTFLMSIDGGASWTLHPYSFQIGPGNGPLLLGVTPANREYVYVASIENFGNIFRSTDGGVNFNPMKYNTIPGLTGYQPNFGDYGQGWYDFAFYADQNDAEKIYFGSIFTHISNDGGISWNTGFANASNIHPDQQYIGKNPLLSDRLWLTNDGGVYCKFDTDSLIIPKQNNLAVTQAYHFDADQYYDSTFAIGTQDNGASFTNNGTDYILCLGGDVYSRIYCAFNDNIAYFPGASTTNFNIYSPWATAPNPLPETGNVEPMSFNPITPTTAFLANSQIWKTNDLNANPVVWRQIFTNNTMNPFVSLNHSLVDSNLFYAIRMDGYLFRSTNVLSSNPIFDSLLLPTTTIWNTTIATLPNNSNTLYLAGDSIYVSQDRGVTWTNITNGLSTYYDFRKLIADPYETDGSIYVMATNKIYYKNDSTNWIEFTNQLPVVSYISDIAIRKYSSQKHVLWANLYGRGVWQSPAYQMLVNGVEEKEMDESAITLYPVPASTYLNVLGANGILLKHVVIYDAQGREVAKMKNEVSKEKLIIPVSALSNGVYYLEVNTGKGTAMKKFVVNR